MWFEGAECKTRLESKKKFNKPHFIFDCTQDPSGIAVQMREVYAALCKSIAALPHQRRQGESIVNVEEFDNLEDEIQMSDIFDDEKKAYKENMKPVQFRMSHIDYARHLLRDSINSSALQVCKIIFYVCVCVWCVRVLELALYQQCS